MSFEEFYEAWWLDHQNNVLAPTPKEAMRQAWLAGRKAEKAAQQSVHPTASSAGGRRHPAKAIKQIRALLVKHGGG